MLKQARYLCLHRYKAAMQEAQTKSRSLAVAMQSLQRKQAQWPAMPSPQSDNQSQPMQQAHTLLKSAMKQQAMAGSGREAVDRLRPMTASSVMQAKLGAPASILTRPSSALSRCVLHVCYRSSKMHLLLQCLLMMLAEYTVIEDHCSYGSWQTSELVRLTLSSFTGLLAASAACDLEVSKLPGVPCQPRSRSLMQSTLCCPDIGVLACLVCTALLYHIWYMV